MSSNADFRGDADDKTLADLNSITKQAVEIRNSDGKNMLRERKVSKDGNESSDENEGEIKHTNSKLKLSKFVKKYFLEGQSSFCLSSSTVVLTSLTCHSAEPSWNRRQSMVL